MMEATDLDLATAPPPLPAQKWNNKSSAAFLLTDLTPSPACSHIFVAGLFKAVNQYNDN